MTFDEAMARVWLAHEGLLAEREALTRGEAQERATRGLLWPQVDVHGRYTRLNESISIDLDPIRQVILGLHPEVPPSAVPPFQAEIRDESVLGGQIIAQWPVYAGGRIRAARAAGRHATEEAREHLRRTTQGLMTTLAERYFGLRLARALLKVKARVLDRMGEHLRQAEVLEREGQIPAAERLHARVAFDEAQREHQRSLRAAEIAEVGLAALLSVEGSLSLATPMFVIPAEEGPEDLAYFLAASDQHPLLSWLQAKEEQAAHGTRAIRGRFLPEVYLFGYHELNRDGLTLLDPEWAAGVGLRLPLLDRSGRSDQLRAARSLERQLEFQRRQIQRDLRTLVERYYREMALAREEYASLASSLELAQENVRLRESAFREGMATSLDVVDARLALARSETARLVSAHGFVLGLARLLEASGRSERFVDYLAREDKEVLP